MMCWRSVLFRLSNVKLFSNAVAAIKASPSDIFCYRNISTATRELSILTDLTLPGGWIRNCFGYRVLRGEFFQHLGHCFPGSAWLMSRPFGSEPHLVCQRLYEGEIFFIVRIDSNAFHWFFASKIRRSTGICYPFGPRFPTFCPGRVSEKASVLYQISYIVGNKPFRVGIVCVPIIPSRL